jgi:poly(glycerol-phosphate) alpha-glucosyltransferase
VATGELPEGRYLTCNVRVDPNAGGETRAALMRNRIFARAGGIHPTMLTFAAANNYPDRRNLLLERGLLLPEISLLNIYDHYRLHGWPDADGSGKGLKDLSRHTVIEQMSPDGSPWRVVHSLPGGRHIADYLRPDGTVYLRIPLFDFRKAESWPRKIRRVAESGEITGSFNSLGEWFRGWVRELTAGDERAFVFMESRGVVPHLVPMPGADNLHLVYLLHNMHLDRPRRWDSRLAGKSYARLLERIPALDAMVTLTERQRQDIALRRGDTENLFVVPNPVDMPAAPAHEVTRDRRRIAVVARLEPQKRLGHALRAFARVVESVPEAHFDIYGRGPLSATLAQQARELGIERSVTMHGHDPNAREALWRATALVMTSRYEGYPLAVLESMSHGCPVVSYDVKYGPREQISDGVDGFLVPPGDTEALADRLIELLESPELAQRMSRAATEKAKQHGKNEFVADWAAVLEKTVELKPRRTRLLGADLDVQSLVVGGRGGRGLLGLRSTTPAGRFPPTATVRLEATLRVKAQGSVGDLAAARVELDAVSQESGVVVGLPVDWTLENGTFKVRSDVCLRDQPPPGDRPAGPVRLRLRLVWRNSVWQGWLDHPPEPSFTHTGGG